jgi:hypothetical protein
VLASHCVETAPAALGSTQSASSAAIIIVNLRLILFISSLPCGVVMVWLWCRR